MKKILILILGIICLMPLQVFAEDKKDITIYMFRRYDCSHCEDALKYFDEHRDLIPDYVTIMTYEVGNNLNNEKLQDAVADYLEVDKTKNYGTPFFVIGDEYIKGYGTGTFNELLSIAESFEKEEEEYKDITALVAEEEKLEVKGVDFNTLYKKPSAVVTIIVYSIFGIIVLGVVGMILFSRKN